MNDEKILPDSFFVCPNPNCECHKLNSVLGEYCKDLQEITMNHYDMCDWTYRKLCVKNRPKEFFLHILDIWVLNLKEQLEKKELFGWCLIEIISICLVWLAINRLEHTNEN